MLSLYNQSAIYNNRLDYSFWDKSCSVYEIDGVLRGKFILIKNIAKTQLKLLQPSGNILQIDRKYLDIREIPLLDKYGVNTAKINYSDEWEHSSNLLAYNSNYVKFCKYILNFEYMLYKDFFYVIQDYLTKRKSQGKELTHHDIMRISLSECIESIYLLNTLLLQDIGREELKSISSTLLHGLKMLSMCAGGRSFTGDNVLEIFWVSSLLNKFLFGSDLNEDRS